MSEKKLEDMTLGELVHTLVVETVNYATGQVDSGPPFHTKEQINDWLRKDYIKSSKEIIEELNQREKLYKTRYINKADELIG